MTDLSQPLITVYITCYNYERYVEQAIESVLNQNFNDYELIIIDDGSTDNSADIITRYQTNPKTRIVLQENKGLNRTNNVALTLSRGKYIIRLDADDYLDPDALLLLSNRLEANPELGLVFPDYYLVDAEGRILSQIRRHDFKSEVSLLDQPAHGACTMIRKSYLIGIGGYSERYRCQDGYDIWLRFIEKHKVQNVSLPLFYYRQHGENLTSNEYRILETRAQIIKQHAKAKELQPIDCLGILMARGKALDPACPAMENLGQHKVIDWSIEAALKSESISKLVLSTPDKDIIDYVTGKYGDEIVIHDRPSHLGLETVIYEKILEHIFAELIDINSYQAAMILSPLTPFRSSMYIDKAVNTMRIFEVDGVIGVTPETDSFYVHNGHGLKKVGAQLGEDILEEPEFLLRSMRGMHLVSLKYYSETGLVQNGRVGHVTFDMNSSLVLDSSSKIALANILIKSGAIPLAT